MRYCRRCIYPETKPDLFIDEEGICSACRNYEARVSVDYAERAKQLQAILRQYHNPAGYDCIVPGSGGKDSTFQALTIRDMGFNPLVVTAATDHLTDLGRRNIENVKALGFDVIEVTPDVAVRRQINKMALETVGDISWPEHVLIFTVPVRIAMQMGIPLIIWGENPQHEYGGPAAAAESCALTRRWLEEFGGLLGLRVSDLGFPARKLVQYTYPTDEELKRVGVTGLFLGYFLDWDGYHNYMVSKANGFTPYDKTVEGSLFSYENLDNAYTGIHDYFKYLKYGFGRATDLACNHIRRGRITRDEALAMVKGQDGAFPHSYLGVSLDTILEELGMTRGQFDAVCERFKCSPQE